MSRSVEEFLDELDDVLSTTGQDTETGQRDTTPGHDTETGQPGQHDTTVVEDRTRPDTRDTETGQDETPRVVRVTGKSSRLPDWWNGPRAFDALNETTGQDGTDTETPRQDETPGHDTETTEAGQEEPEEPDTRTWRQYVLDEMKTGWKSAWSKEQSDKADEDTTPPWDPTQVADRILDSHRDRPVHQRATTAAQTALAAVTAPRPSTGRLLYAASSIGFSWWIGLTPWLTDRLTGAPIGVSIGLVIVGWSIHQATARAAAPVRWCAHSLFTCCVIAAFLHS